MIPTLHIDPDLRNQRNERGRFIKGMTTYNKGKKFRIGQNPGCFTPGHKPHNLKPEGYECLRKSKGEMVTYIKSEGKMVRKNRWLWEKHNGKIPDGYLVVYKDGDQTNCTIDNLTMVSRGDNVRRNCNREKAAKSLKKLWDSERLRLTYGLPQKSKFKPSWK
jgi:hypothetical protein